VSLTASPIPANLPSVHRSGNDRIPRSSRRRSPEAPARARQSPQGHGEEALLSPGIPAYSRPSRNNQDRPVTPEVAGSSPVAPVSQNACILADYVVRFVGNQYASGSKRAGAFDLRLVVLLPVRYRDLVGPRSCPDIRLRDEYRSHERPARTKGKARKRGPSLHRTFWRRRLRDRSAAGVAVFVEGQPVAQVVAMEQVEEPAPTPD
jgi:hypothetical protein